MCSFKLVSSTAPRSRSLGRSLSRFRCSSRYECARYGYASGIGDDRSNVRPNKLSVVFDDYARCIVLVSYTMHPTTVCSAESARAERFSLDQVWGTAVLREGVDLPLSIGDFRGECFSRESLMCCRFHWIYLEGDES